jgi:hypothetical protein
MVFYNILLSKDTQARRYRAIPLCSQSLVYAERRKNGKRLEDLQPGPENKDTQNSMNAVITKGMDVVKQETQESKDPAHLLNCDCTETVSCISVLKGSETSESCVHKSLDPADRIEQREKETMRWWPLRVPTFVKEEMVLVVKEI